MIIVMRYGGLQDFMVMLRPTKMRKHGLYLSPSNIVFKSLGCALEALMRLLVVLRRSVAILDKPNSWIDFVRPPFLWSKNNCEEGRIRVRLDRTLANNEW